MAEIEFVGVDGCPFGWFSVGFASDGEYVTEKFCTFSELVDHYKKAKLILVDIPIGLPEGNEGRRADKEARSQLKGGRKSSVFPTPTRHTTDAIWEGFCDYERAKEIERQYAKTKNGLSIQAFAICPKIAEVDKLMLSRGDGATSLIREIHPEICFWALNGKESMEASKKTKSGIKDRLDVIRKVDQKFPKIFKTARSQFLKKDVADDDILDALAAAVTARFGYPEPQKLPENPPKDPKGLPMEMVYWIPPCPCSAVPVG